MPTTSATEDLPLPGILTGRAAGRLCGFAWFPGLYLVPEAGGFGCGRAFSGIMTARRYLVGKHSFARQGRCSPTTRRSACVTLVYAGDSLQSVGWTRHGVPSPDPFVRSALAVGMRCTLGLLRLFAIVCCGTRCCCRGGEVVGHRRRTRRTKLGLTRPCLMTHAAGGIPESVGQDFSRPFVPVMVAQQGVTTQWQPSSSSVLARITLLSTPGQVAALFGVRLAV